MGKDPNSFFSVDEHPCSSSSSSTVVWLGGRFRNTDMKTGSACGWCWSCSSYSAVRYSSTEQVLWEPPPPEIWLPCDLNDTTTLVEMVFTTGMHYHHPPFSSSSSSSSWSSFIVSLLIFQSINQSINQSISAHTHITVSIILALSIWVNVPSFCSFFLKDFDFAPAVDCFHTRFHTRFLIILLFYYFIIYLFIFPRKMNWKLFGRENK